MKPPPVGGAAAAPRLVPRVRLGRLEATVREAVARCLALDQGVAVSPMWR